MKAYLRSLTDPTKFTDFADYAAVPPFPAPAGFEWVEGEPTGLSPAVNKQPIDKMRELVATVPAAIRAQFAPAIAEVITLLNEGDYDAVRLVIQGLTLPAEYQGLVAQLLACL